MHTFWALTGLDTFKTGKLILPNFTCICLNCSAFKTPHFVMNKSEVNVGKFIGQCFFLEGTIMPYSQFPTFQINTNFFLLYRGCKTAKQIVHINETVMQVLLVIITASTVRACVRSVEAVYASHCIVPRLLAGSSFQGAPYNTRLWRFPSPTG